MNNIYIIAGTYEQFKMFISQLAEAMIAEGLTVRRSDFIYVDGPDRLRGIISPWGYKVGNWYNRKDLDCIERTIKVCRSDFNEDFIPVEL